MRKIIFMAFSFMFCLSASANVNMDLIKSAEKYLNSITGLDGGFTQTSNGKTQTGNFSMLRPGRVRLDYTNAIDIGWNGFIFL